MALPPSVVDIDDEKIQVCEEPVSILQEPSICEHSIRDASSEQLLYILKASLLTYMP